MIRLDTMGLSVKFLSGRSQSIADILLLDVLELLDAILLSDDSSSAKHVRSSFVRAAVHCNSARAAAWRPLINENIVDDARKCDIRDGVNRLRIDVRESTRAWIDGRSVLARNILF